MVLRMVDLLAVEKVVRKALMKVDMSVEMMVVSMDTMTAG